MPQILIKASGPDHPGISARLMGALRGARILDISQAVIHELLTVCVLFEVKEVRPVITALETAAREMGLRLESQAFSEEKPVFPGPKHPYALTLIADRGISAHALEEVMGRLAAAGANIDRMTRLSHEGFNCLEMKVSTYEPLPLPAFKAELLAIARRQGMDVGLQAEGLYRRAKRLVVFDMDSTLIRNEVIDELAREQGVYEEVARITHDAMSGGLDFDESLRLRCAKLEGLPLTAVEAVYDRLELSPGAEDLVRILRILGYQTALISGGFTFMAERFQKRLKMDHAYANTLEVRDGRLTGRVIPPIVNARRKAELVELLAHHAGISLEQVIAIGDGANDLLMLAKAGLGIAFNAKASVSERADLAISQKSLLNVLHLLGLSSADIKEALASK